MANQASGALSPSTDACLDLPAPILASGNFLPVGERVEDRAKQVWYNSLKFERVWDASPHPHLALALAKPERLP